MKAAIPSMNPNPVRSLWRRGEPGAVMDDEMREEWLQGHQDGRVYPLGRALRRTWDAENHDTLGSDVTGLMIDLSKVPYEAGAAHPVAPVVPAPLSHQSGLRPSILARLGGLIGWR